MLSKIAVNWCHGMKRYRSEFGMGTCEIRLYSLIKPIGSMYGIYMCHGLNSHYFHIMGDGHQPNSRGLYTHYKDCY